MFPAQFQFQNWVPPESYLVATYFIGGDWIQVKRGTWGTNPLLPQKEKWRNRYDSLNRLHSRKPLILGLNLRHIRS